MNTQIVCDKNGIIMDMTTGLSGRMHDRVAIMFSTALGNFTANLPAPYVIIGDSAYQGYSNNLVVPFHGNAPRTAAQTQFNRLLSQQRQIVERVNGAIEVKWRVTQMKENRLAAKYGVLNAARLVIAAGVLHNLFTNYL
jgi:hypothetical protein